MCCSIIVPAWNEAAFIGDSLTHIREAMAAVAARDVVRDGKLIVVDDNSTDDTAAIAREHGASVVFWPINRTARARNPRPWRRPGMPWCSSMPIRGASGQLLGAALDRLAGGRVAGSG